MFNDVVVAVAGAVLGGRLVPGWEPESGPSHAATATASNDATTARILMQLPIPNSQFATSIPDLYQHLNLGVGSWKLGVHADYCVDASSSNIADETASGRSRGMK